MKETVCTPVPSAELPVNLGDSAHIKRVLDEVSSQVVFDEGYPEYYYVSNVKIGLGIITCAFALVAQFYPKGFPDNSNILLCCVIGYMLFNTLLQVFSMIYEKDAILFTHPKAVGSSGTQSSSSTGLTLATHLPRFSDRYLLRISSADPNSLAAREPVVLEKSITEWFYDDGILAEDIFRADLRNWVVSCQSAMNKWQEAHSAATASTGNITCRATKAQVLLQKASHQFTEFLSTLRRHWRRARMAFEDIQAPPTDVDAFIPLEEGPHQRLETPDQIVHLDIAPFAIETVVGAERMVGAEAMHTFSALLFLDDQACKTDYWAAFPNQRSLSICMYAALSVLPNATIDLENKVHPVPHCLRDMMLLRAFGDSAEVTAEKREELARFRWSLPGPDTQLAHPHSIGADNSATVVHESCVKGFSEHPVFNAAGARCPTAQSVIKAVTVAARRATKEPALRKQPFGPSAASSSNPVAPPKKTQTRGKVAKAEKAVR
ncbi:hypothetical protein CYMTET_10465 [Cymbomonas tetramitiformis]|uniref:Signal peptidase complex subunit 2 n=1 Tax=Cymbomonas tetramitiformis TaxID=36881 RepID=A0AAE0GP72_9CHLO|nr:hypothetical protein CYMTET_37658 [Cymbomonas tetramitiformis]KAK3281774.1 hypothetical protein CYMTET_10465 [Cymbomonas tetramitiformis]